MRERMSEADGEFEEDTDAAAAAANLSPSEKRALDAERRAEWRKARLRSLENVSGPRILNELEIPYVVCL